MVCSIAADTEKAHEGEHEPSPRVTEEERLQEVHFLRLCVVTSDALTVYWEQEHK